MARVEELSALDIINSAEAEQVNRASPEALAFYRAGYGDFA